MPQIQIDQLRSIISTLREVKHETPLLNDNNDLTDDEIAIAMNAYMTATIDQNQY